MKKITPRYAISCSLTEEDVVVYEQLRDKNIRTVDIFRAGLEKLSGEQLENNH